MSGIGKRLLTSAFRVALWAGIGAGIAAVTDSPQKEQRNLPSLSQQDARKDYHNRIELLALFGGALELESIHSKARDRRKERAPAPLAPT
jgi:hypothetical protein